MFFFSLSFFNHLLSFLFFLNGNILIQKAVQKEHTDRLPLKKEMARAAKKQSSKEISIFSYLMKNYIENIVSRTST